MKTDDSLAIMEDKVRIPQATKEGFIECEVGGVYDGSYPDSKTRRGRVQGGGVYLRHSPATAMGCEESSLKSYANLEPKSKKNEGE